MLAIHQDTVFRGTGVFVMPNRLFVYNLLDNVNTIVYNIVSMKGDERMQTAPTQVRIDADIKREATALFSKLGLDMSGAVNLFLHQCVLRGGLPFPVEMPQYSETTIAAMEEARRISSDPIAKTYSSMEELKAALDE